ncbi:hypothetical protein BWK60_05875 [Flavobacterium covae]|nr:hypothetical protein BWK60_05875 [Flavobacterium covae]
MVPNRHSSSNQYIYGFNGKEKDDQIKGEGLQYDYGFRIYDPRIAKFLSQDPLLSSFPWWTPYQFAGNTPIQAVDLDGKEVYDYRLDLDDKGHKVGFKFLGENTHGFKGWSVWNLFGVKIPAVDIYQNGKFVARYSFNTSGQGGFDTLKKFVVDESFRKQYVSDNMSVEQANHNQAEDIGKTFEEGFTTAGVVNYAKSRAKATKQEQTPTPVENNAPPISRTRAVINDKHILTSNNVAKTNKITSEVTTLARYSTLKADLEAYNQGNFTKIPNSNGNVSINGNIYGVKNAGSTIYPISGSDFINLNKAQIKAIQLTKKVPSEKLDAAAKGAGLSEGDMKFAQDFVKKY